MLKKYNLDLKYFSGFKNFWVRLFEEYYYFNKMPGEKEQEKVLNTDNAKSYPLNLFYENFVFFLTNSKKCYSIPIAFLQFKWNEFECCSMSIIYNE